MIARTDYAHRWQEANLVHVLALEKGLLRELVRAVDLVELDDRQHGPDVVLCKVRRAGNGNWEVAQEESVPGLRVL